MKIKYIFQLALINLSRRKARAIISILLLTIALTMLISTLSLSSSMLNFMSDNFKNNVGCRTLFVDYDPVKYTEANIIDKVSRYKHVAAATSQGNSSLMLTLPDLVNQVQLQDFGSNDGKVTLRGGNKYAVPNIIGGRNFKDGETNAAIIPEKFLPDSRIELIKDISKQLCLDGKSFLGKKLTGKTETGTNYTFTVIGVYDSLQSMDKEDTCYIPYHDIAEMNNTEKTSSSDTSYPVMAVVDNYENMQTVMNQLYKNGMEPSVKVVFNTALPIFINVTGGILSIIIFIVALINISLTTINSVKDRAKEIGLLKSIGYNNKTVLIILNAETIILGIIGFILSALFSSSILLLLSRIAANEDSYNSKIPIYANTKVVLLALLISIAVPAIACIFAGSKTIKIQPSDAMKE